MHIIHVNLARGFRGGERQTVLLIQALAKQDEIGRQTLVCQPSSPLRAELADTPDVEFVNANHQLAGHWQAGKGGIIHAHEAKAVHWAWLHSVLFRTPYIITRRVDTPIKRKWSNKVFYRYAHCCVAISNVIAREINALVPRSIFVIASAYTPVRHNPDVAKKLRDTYPGRFIVGHIGALVDRHKGQRVLLEVARQFEKTYPEVLFVFFGKGEDEHKLQQESEFLSNVRWLGFKANIGDYMPALDLFAFPSRNEGLGSVLLDIMSAKVSIIASDVGGIPDIITHEQTGLLVPPNNAAMLADGIKRMMNDSRLRAELSYRAFAQLENYSPDAMAAAYLPLYRSI
ncbi:glycosyltransferase involved in cell wall biosynthesis [Halomonas alkaliantarctica]|nr:glycosyltransferase family 4 protein [Halomonas sp.]TDV91589.1 glycosyltransferase involved in cell wall biosynthesis [Halomonas alkaliantarctica]